MMIQYALKCGFCVYTIHFRLCKVKADCDDDFLNHNVTHVRPSSLLKYIHCYPFVESPSLCQFVFCIYICATMKAINFTRDATKLLKHLINLWNIWFFFSSIFFVFVCVRVISIKVFQIKSSIQSFERPKKRKKKREGKKRNEKRNAKEKHFNRDLFVSLKEFKRFHLMCLLYVHTYERVI